MADADALPPAPGSAEKLAPPGAPGAAAIDPDLSAAVSLLAEALAPDDGREAKVHRLMSGLCRLVDADAWIWIRTRVGDRGRSKPSNIDFVRGGGFTEAVLAEYADWSLEVHGVPPENRWAKDLMCRGRHWTRSRPELVGDAEWSTPPVRAHVKRMGFDEFVWSLLPVVEGPDSSVCSGPLILRRPGRAAFDARACELVHWIVRESGALHADGLDPSLGDAVAGLTPREHSVLTMLLDGAAPAAIAAGLRLSVATVNGHVRTVHDHFGVQSRAELLRCFRRGPLHGSTDER